MWPNNSNMPCCPSGRRNRGSSSIIWPPPAATEPNQFRREPIERDSCKREKYDRMHSLREELELWKAKYEEAVRDGQEMDAKPTKTLYIPFYSSGNDCPPPPPLEKFSDGGLDSIVARNIKLSGYDRPTPLQQHVIPIIKGGRDLVVCSQRGSGTRAAFFVPIISVMHKNPPSDGYGYGRYSDRGYTRRNIIKPRALVLAPHRELSHQICDEAKKLSYNGPLRAAVATGGKSINALLRELERGAEILVSTPGRLVDLIDRAHLSLSEVRYLILKDADRMLDMGFEPQIRRIVEEEDMPHAAERQTLLFSATFPTEMQRLAANLLNDWIFFRVELS